MESRKVTSAVPKNSAGDGGAMTDLHTGRRTKMDLTNVMELQGTEIIADGVELAASTASDGC